MRKIAILIYDDDKFCKEATRGIFCPRCEMQGDYSSTVFYCKIFYSLLLQENGRPMRCQKCLDAEIKHDKI